MRLARRALRHLLAVALAGLAAHGAFLAAVVGAGWGGPFADFAAAAVQRAGLVAVTLGVARDGLAQAAWLAFGPFFAPFAGAVAATALLAIMLRSRAALAQVAGAAALAALPLALRLGAPQPGAPVVVAADVALALACGAFGGLLYWLVAGRVIGKGGR